MKKIIILLLLCSATLFSNAQKLIGSELRLNGTLVKAISIDTNLLVQNADKLITEKAIKKLLQTRLAGLPTGSDASKYDTAGGRLAGNFFVKTKYNYDASLSWHYIGDSKTQTDILFRRWCSIISEYFNVIEDNIGTGGRKLQGGLSADFSLIPTKTKNDEKLFIYLGANDLINSDTVTYNAVAYSAAYRNCLDNALSKNWLGCDIVIMSASYINTGQWPYATQSRQVRYRDTARGVANSYGCVFVDLLTPTNYLQNATGGAINSGDGLHENNNGQDYIANIVLPYINYSVKKDTRNSSVNDTLEVKDLRLSGLNSLDLMDTSLRNNIVLGLNKNGHVAALPWNEIARNTTLTGKVQSTFLNIRGIKSNIFHSDGSAWRGVAGVMQCIYSDASDFAQIKVGSIVSNSDIVTGGNLYINGYRLRAGGTLDVLNNDASDFYSMQMNRLYTHGPISSPQYTLSSLNAAPSSSSDTGTTGEIRVTASYIYVCTATNTWVRSALSTW